MYEVGVREFVWDAPPPSIHGTAALPSVVRVKRLKIESDSGLRKVSAIDTTLRGG